MRRYSNLAGPLPLISGINSSAPTLSVSSTAGYPEVPFLLSIDRGTPKEEVCLCTTRGASSFTVTRGYDGTTGVAHDPGAIVEHVTAAVDHKEAGIVRIPEATRDALLAGEIWEGRLIWNSTVRRYEFRDTQGTVDTWSDLMPTGVVIPFAGSVATDGWLFCHGQTLNRADYSRLFAAIGTAFGAGDGTTTFSLPDMRRRFPLGRHTTAPYDVLNSPGGAMDHIHTNPSVTSAGAHTHTQTATLSAGNHKHTNSNTTQGGQHNHGGWSYGATKTGVTGGHSFAGQGTDPQDHQHGVVNQGNHQHDVPDTSNAGAHTHTNPSTASAGAHTHTQPATGTANPPYIVLDYIIKV